MILSPKYGNGKWPTKEELEVLIDTKKKQGLLKSYNLQKVEKLTDLLTTYKEFSRPVSYVDVIKYSKQAFYNGDSSYYSLPNSQEHATILSYLKNSNNNLGFESLLIDSLAQQARISLRMADISTSKMDSIFYHLIPRINSIFDSDKYDVIVTGTSIVFLNGTKFLLRNLALSLFLVVILISAFIAWLFKSFKMVIISIIPNIIPLLLTAAFMGYFSIALKPSTILVFSIAFGISVDDTIHFLAKYRQELLENKGNIKASVLSALKETGVSMFYTSVVLFSGFFIFMLCAILELLAKKMTYGSIIFSNLVGYVLGYRLIHFGYMPQNTYMLLTSILITIIGLFLLKKILVKD